jgi:16S rRNA (cytosine1402-N4)-methyltransferase
MAPEVLAALNVRAGGVYADGTLGGAGHAEAILRASAPDGWLYGCDRDEAAVRAAEARLARYAGRFEIRRGSFSEMADWIAPETCQGALLDLGVSAPHLEKAERGFSFQQDGPLDMRMDTRQSVTAATLVNETRPEQLARWFWELGGERQGLRLARAIERERAVAPIQTTGQLAALVERLNPRRGRRIHPATRVFQALRMAVNDEAHMLEAGLKAVWSLLRPGGRLAVITFHSVEDRLVKTFGRERVRAYTLPAGVDVPELRQPAVPQARWVSRKAIQPSAEELAGNPRCRSAQLRILEKI